MPSKDAIELAYPLCDGKVITPTNIRSRPLQQGTHGPCYTRLTYDRAANEWHCTNPRCKAVHKGEAIAARVNVLAAA